MLYLINTKPNPKFIIGDAELNRWAVENRIKVNSDYGKKGMQDVYKSSKSIQRFLKMCPGMEVLYSHDKLEN